MTTLGDSPGRDASRPGVDGVVVDTAMILAAGRGERMRPLTDRTPKPLLQVHGKPLIVWHVEALARAGVRHIVVNTAWLEEQIVATLDDGSRHGVRISYSLEGRDHGGALETAGGIATARPWTAADGRANVAVMGAADGVTAPGEDCFWLVSADIYCPEFRFDAALARRFASSRDLAHLWLVPNPAFHQQGDFTLDAAGRVRRTAAPDAPRFTYANIALCRAALTKDVAPGAHAALGPLLFAAADADAVAGTLLTTEWHNVGTPDQLAALNLR